MSSLKREAEKQKMLLIRIINEPQFGYSYICRKNRELEAAKDNMFFRLRTIWDIQQFVGLHLSWL